MKFFKGFTAEKKIQVFFGQNFNFVFYSKLPPRIATFKLLKGCHLGFGNLKTFLESFSKKTFSKKKFFSKKKTKKTYVFPTSGLAQRMPLEVFE